MARVDLQMEGILLGPQISVVEDGIYQITLSPPMDGFSDFISAWLVQGRPSFLVDVGPASTAGQLLAALNTLGVTRLDYIFLTHIHLDHAGAIGQISARFPQARIVCHEKGIPHLVDPTQLWEGTRKVLGAVADGYGALDPVPPERFVPAQGFAADGIAALITPGHAPHHVSYFTPACLFAGEACGVWFRFGGGHEYMRPATPPRFLMNVALASIETLIACAPTRMVVGHFGMVEDGAQLLTRHREQLVFWEKWIGERIGEPTGDAAVSRCMEGLLAEDPLLSAFDRFPPPAQKREQYFMGNSINGFLGWLKNSEEGRRKAE
jgi:glyoxylase-like metal-dependent hydrolase (beta-lactamase superfamily II)